MSTTIECFKRIALVRLSALGDVTLMLPVVRTLKAVHPDSKITWIIGESVYPLLAGIDDVEFIVIKRPSRLADYRRLQQQLKDRQFDVLLACQASLRANLIYPLIPAKLKIGFDYERARDGQWLFTNRRINADHQHLLDSFFAFLEPLGIHERTLRWDIPLPDEALTWAEELIGEAASRVLVVNPGASKPERNWHAQGYIAVIQEAQRRWGVKVMLTGGHSAAERTLGEHIAAHCESVNLIGQTNHKQLAALLARATCLLAPDTGPVHIAAAFNTPVVGLYAVAPPELSGPYLFQHLVVNRYPDAVRQLLGKDPKSLPWGTRVHDTRAMAMIEPDTVLAQLSQIFDNKNSAY